MNLFELLLCFIKYFKELWQLFSHLRLDLDSAFLFLIVEINALCLDSIAFTLSFNNNYFLTAYLVHKIVGYIRPSVSILEFYLLLAYSKSCRFMIFVFVLVMLIILIAFNKNKFFICLNCYFNSLA